MSAVARVPLGEVVRRVCYSAHSDLEKLSLKLTNTDDLTRKKLLHAYLTHMRHRLIKLLALVKWVSKSGRLVNDLLILAQDYGNNLLRIFEATGALRLSSSALQISRAPAYDISNAVDILSTG